ncbi:MAG: PH domain-containing protein [Verrucomicrobiales bacterium]
MAELISSETPPPASPGEEQVLWRGSPSQWQNFWWWLSCLLIIPIPIAIWKWLILINTDIALTNQRLKIRRGVFNKETEEVELYRVKDWTIEEPFLQRMLGKGSVRMETSDRTAPTLTLPWLDDPRRFGDLLRTAVELIRDRKRVREVDYQDEHPGDGG